MKIQKVEHHHQIAASAVALPVRKRVQGFADVQDRLASCLSSTERRPNIVVRALLMGCIGLLHFLSLPLYLYNLCCAKSSESELYNDLFQVSHSPEEARALMQKISCDNFAPTCVRFWMQKLLQLPVLHPHLKEIMCGANVKFEGDNGFACKWAQDPQARQRMSSHRYKDDLCHEIGHGVFWQDCEGNTHLQFQRSPLKNSLFSAVQHLIDYLNYKKDGLQQGPSGTSPHVEDHCLLFKLS
jgi:hypothetical protein